MAARFSRDRFALGALAVAGLAAPGRPALGQQQFKWKWGISLNREHSVSVRAAEGFAKIRRDTGGRLDIEAFPNAVLGNDPQMLEQLRVGALEMLGYAGGTLDTLVPVASIESVAFIFPSRDVAFAAMDGELGAIVRQDTGTRGIVVLDHLWEAGYREFTTSTHPIHTAADLAGVRLRVPPGKLRIDTFRSLGASPTPVVPSELYTALQTHIVDAQESTLLVIDAFRLYEVQGRYSHSLTQSRLGRPLESGQVPTSGARTLPAEFQAIVQRRMTESVMLQRRDSLVQSRSVADKLRREGLTINPTSPESFRSKLRASGYYERWREEYGPRAWAALEKYAGKLA